MVGKRVHHQKKQKYQSISVTKAKTDKFRDEELLEPIINDINEVLKRIGDNESYDYIFDAEMGGVLFADEKYDISEYVLEEIKKGISSQ